MPPQFSQLDAVGGQVPAAGGLPPIEGYTASVDLVTDLYKSLAFLSNDALQ